MTATATILSPSAAAAVTRPRPARSSPTQLLGLCLLLPAAGFLLAFFVIPALTLFAYSVLNPNYG
jgi:ABC-type sugar transport system permease subunit